MVMFQYVNIIPRVALLRYGYAWRIMPGDNQSEGSFPPFVANDDGNDASEQSRDHPDTLERENARQTDMQKIK